MVAFIPSQTAYQSVTRHFVVASARTTKFVAINDSNGESDYGNDSYISIDQSLDIVRGSETEISDETWTDIEGGAPSRWMVMKDVSSRYDTITMC